MKERLIIGAPFGNYLSFPGAVSTLGTYTLERRAGPLLRLWRVLRTVRHFRGAWINKLGLPSPGIFSLSPEKCEGKVLSVHGFDENEWDLLIEHAKFVEPVAMEMNFSCPNVLKTAVREASHAARQAVLRLPATCHVIAKLPPVKWLQWGEALHAAGVRWFHLCNTIPTTRGGISGKPLKPYSLWAVEDFRKRFGGEVTLVGGGGITNLQDVKDYMSAGADKVSVASMLFNPFNWKKVKQFVEELSCTR